MEVFCSSRAELDEIWDQQWLRDAWALEEHLARRHLSKKKWVLSGFCRACRRGADFLVDRNFGARRVDGVWIPNWRERLTCPGCGLNNRQRVVAWKLRAAAAARGGGARVYLTEQVTALYRWATASLGDAELVGSEYLPDPMHRTRLGRDLRHEDLEALSFPSRSFDVIACNDVLEHVDQPDRAIGELARVMRPGGTLLLTVPFFPDRDESVTRARIEDGRVRHHLEPVYHGNPVSRKGSLVFTDFGWDLLDRFRRAGFARFGVTALWSYVYGHLGGPVLVFLGSTADDAAGIDPLSAVRGDTAVDS